MIASFRSAIFLTCLFGIFSPSHSATAADPLPRPAGDQRDQAVKVIRDVFKKDYEESEKGTHQKKELASKLIEASAEENDSVMQYALLTEAIKLQAAALLAQDLIETTDRMSQAFDINDIKIKVYFLRQVADATEKKSDSTNLIKAIQPVIDQAIAADQYDRALTLIAAAAAMGERTRDRKLVKQMNGLADDIRDEGMEFRNVEKAQQTLKDNPLDAEANQTVGEWYCLKKNRWDEGITYLALGNDPEMRELGRVDLKIEKSPDDEMQLGDLCWNLVEKMPDNRAALRDRAIFWYERAQPELSGIAAKKVEGRIEEWKAENEPPPKIEKPEKDEQPKLAKSPKPLTKVKPKKSIAPTNPQGIPLWNRNGRVLAGTTPIQIPGKNNLYLHPYPEPGKSALIFDLGGRYRSFTGAVGVPDVVGYRGPPRSEIRFSVLRDGKETELASTGRRGPRSFKRFTLDITGVKKLVLVTSCSGNPEGCFAFWFNPVISPAAAKEEVGEESDDRERAR